MPTMSGNVVEVKEYPKNIALKMDDGQFYGGFKNADNKLSKVAQGDSVTFEFEKNGRFNNIKPGTIEKGGGQAAPAKSQGGGSVPAQSTFNDTRQLSIHYQSSRNAAIAFIEAAVKADALVLPAKKGEKYDALLALTKEATDRFHVELEQVIEDGGVTPDIPMPQGDE